MNVSGYLGNLAIIVCSLIFPEVIFSMSYQPLAVKYRPQNFEQLVGQTATALALSNAVRLGRIPNAIILSGIRGTGKTTVARIFAKALNCSNPQNGSPCLVCDNCQAISSGIHEDVVEIDGASNTGVDDIRALKETVIYLPQRGKYKVYIIDEVHMLSTSAFNALLKTLEEPPSNVVFIFATTEIQKIPETIISRCQTFFLEKISYDDIYSRLVWILDRESISYEDKALKIIVKEAGGSMRDALTLLDKTIVLGGGKVDLESISKISATGSVLCLNLLSYLQKKDTKLVFSTLLSLEDSGIELIKVIDELILLTRHSFILRDLGTSVLESKSLGLDETEYERLIDIAKYSHPLELNTLFRLLVKCRQDLTKTDLDRYIVENYLLEWCLIPYKDPFTSIDPNQNKKTYQPDLSSSSSSDFSFSSDSKMSSTPLNGASSKDNRAFTGLKLSSLDFNQDTSVQNDPTDNKKKSLDPSSNSSVDLSQDSVQGGSSSHLNFSTVFDLDSKSFSKSNQDIAPNSDTSDTKVEASGSLVKSDLFPKTWDELVETWKGKKPFQARILEETICTEYSKDGICLLIDESSLAARQLLQEQQKKSIEESFKTLFGFSGKLKVITENNLSSSPKSTLASSSLNDQDILDKNSALIDNEKGAVTQEPMSILDKKKIQKQQREKFLNEQITGNCITEMINEAFKDNVVTSITVDD